MLNKMLCCGIIIALITTQTVMAEKTNDICPVNQSKDKWDFKNLIIKEYKNKGLKVPDWDSAYFEEEYTFSDLWKSITRKYYDLFAEKYNIPLNFFLFKLFKNHDWASLWDTSGKSNYCSLAEEWLKLADLLQPVYPEIGNWMRRKINDPNQRLRLPRSSMESDLKNLFAGEPGERLDLTTYSDQDFVHQLIEYANSLKEKYQTIKDK